MKEVFKKRLLKCNLRNCRVTPFPNPKTKKYGIDTITYKAAQVWSTLPTRYKNLQSLDLFKSEIKNWHCSACHCNIYRIFVDGVGFINWNYEQFPRGVLNNRQISWLYSRSLRNITVVRFHFDKASNCIWERPFVDCL